MNLSKLFKIQKQLDDRIVKEKKLEGQNLLDKKILALQVELGELANEWRGFKFWSEDQEPRRKKRGKCPTCNGNGIVSLGEGVRGIKVCPDCDNYRGGIKTTYPLLEEYVDCLHFILSIGNGLGFQDITIHSDYTEETATKTFIGIFGDIAAFVSDLKIFPDHARESYEVLFNRFVGLAEKHLGFTWEQIEQAYFDKNKINHERQERGY